MMNHQQNLHKIKILVKGLFKDDHGNPFILTTGEAELFLAIINPTYKWLWLSAPTRYGKSDVLSMAILYLSAVKHLKIPIVGGSEEKAKKIMDYVIKHVADHPTFYNGLLNAEIDKIEQLKISVSKNGLRWHDGGWIYITSVDSRNISAEGQGVVGEGGDVVVLEEAGLIKHKEQFSKIVRMTEEDKGWGKLIQSGNCIEGSVFQEAYNNPIYFKVKIGLDQAISEGRYSTKYLEDKKTQTTSKDWKRYYLVEFPAHNEFTYFKPQIYDTLPSSLKYFGAIDPALGESKQGSLVGIVVLAKAETGQVYEVYNSGQQIKPDEAINRIFSLPFVFERFGVEAVQFQRYFLQIMEQKSKALGKYIPFEAIQQKRKKEERIESLEPYINTGQILFSGQGILWDHFQEYPNLELLDVLDTLEMATRLALVSAFDSFVG